MAAERTAMSSTINVTCIRQTPYMSRTGNDILVNLLVYKKDMNKFAKIEETIPAGFEAKSMESRDGLFTFKEGIAKFVWMNLPEVPGYTISYRLIPVADQTLNGLNISGTLSYIMDGKNIEVAVIQQDVDLSGVTDQNVEKVVAAISKGEAIPVEKPPVRTEVVKPPPPPVKEVKETTPVIRTGTSSRIPSAQLLEVQDGVYFRVQLAATRRFRDANAAYGEYKLTRPVKVESYGGWFKYTVGSFGTYGQASDYKNSALGKGLDGAFVVAYRNGKRIDIMTALQSTGGK